MLFIFDEIETSKHLENDLQKCNINNRLQSHYIAVMKRVQLFLNKESLVNFAGENVSLALLFPMERVFEDYVAYQLKRKYPDRNIKTQDRAHHLIEEHC
jgi:5-methylcytosine-specific restriction enzyme subunit McrC